MNKEEIANRYSILRLAQEEEIHTNCGFAKATKMEQQRVERIKTGVVTQEDMEVLSHLFRWEEIDLTLYLKVEKPSLWQRFKQLL
ncbi:hypothetical protein [Vibrio sonorensis]|uniref:hypothetical protein n=1 Tax=Vibrio sonorensis TaxID=1004316 RepID=UPI0008DB06B0|nr:hypothetical protein [Vibrio sonorensis]